MHTDSGITEPEGSTGAVQAAFFSLRSRLPLGFWGSIGFRGLGSQYPNVRASGTNKNHSDPNS